MTNHAPPTSKFRAAGALPVGPSVIDRIDPRLRVVTAVAAAVVTAVANRPGALLLALAAGLLTVALARLPARALVKRLTALGALMVVLALVLALSVPGTPAWRFGPAVFSREGLVLSGGVALKGSAILLTLLGLLETLDIATLGHALSHLHVPEKLTHLLLFTARYVEVLQRQYGRLVAAMKVRGFRPAMNRHTYRTYGYLVGMLLVRSLERSERIVAAMKCRGFRGRFYLLDHFAFSRRDAWFGTLSAIVLLALVLLEWFPR